MTTSSKLILLGSAAAAVMLGCVAATVFRTRAAAQACTALSMAQTVRTEALLQAIHVGDVIGTRQRNDPVGERESIRLVTAGVLRIEAMLRELEEGGGPAGLSPAASAEDRRDVHECRDLWRLYADAVDEIIRGRAVSRNADFVHASSLRIVQRLSNVVGAAERRHAAHMRALRWVQFWTCAALVAVLAAAAWVLRVEVFAGLRSVLAHIQLLGSGTTAVATKLPETDWGDCGLLAASINRFLERVAAADHTKDQFLAAMSHEIRTPMNGVIGFLGNLRETPLNEQQQQYLRIIESSARNLLRVINGILDFSKLSAGRMQLDDVAFAPKPLLEDCVAMARQLVRSKTVKVELESAGLDDCVVRADPTRLRQVLDNLLGNAAKFTERGTIRLAVGVTPVEDDGVELRFEVSDTGIGMTPEQQKHLFEPFVQAETGTTRKYGGTGLGLCIAANLVTLMGGTLTSRSRRGEGTSFDFTIRVKRGRPEDQVQLSGHYRVVLPPGALRRFWALLVDDTPTNLFLMETICQSIGLPYRTATNGREAVELAKTQRFDLVFMDIQMPVMDGYAAIREIRKLPNSGGTQIVALTASAFQEDVDKALGAGSTGFLAKPFERDQLLLCIAQHLDVPTGRELREPAETHDTPEEVLVRQMHDFMRDQYRISLGEIKMILVQSVADWRPLLDDLRVFSRQQTWDEVRAILHRLKGQLASIGLGHLAEAAGQINAALRTGQTDGAGAAIEAFADDLGAVFRAVERELTVDLRQHG